MKLKNIFIVIVLINLLSIVKGNNLKSSLTFVIDDTYSMGLEIDGVISRTKDIFDAVQNSNKSVIDEFVLVTFNDPDVLFRIATKDADAFKKELENIHVDGGADCPEMALTGIHLGLEMSKPNSNLYVFTDASPKDYKMYETVKNLSQKKLIQISFFLTGKCNYADDEVYENIAEETSGQVFRDMEKHHISEAIGYIIESTKSKKTLITRKIFGGQDKKQVTFKVDNKIEDVVISLSGKNIKSSVKDSEGNIIATENIVNLPSAYVYKFIPNSKTYTIDIYSDYNVTVMITGSTLVTFEHGFSAFKPNSINETYV